jgi:hypothetical protein
MNAIKASILAAGFRLRVTSTCSFSSSGQLGPPIAGDALGRVTFSIETLAGGCAVGLGCGVAVATSSGDGLAVGSGDGEGL